MKNTDSLVVSRSRAVAQLTSVACLEPEWVRGSQLFVAARSWDELDDRRKQAYCAGRMVIRRPLLEKIMLERPEAAEVWDSEIWSCLAEGKTSDAVRGALIERAAAATGRKTVGGTLEKLAKARLRKSPYDLELVATYISAVRTAKETGQLELAGLLSMRLARALYMLAADALYAPVVREVWTHCGNSLVEGLSVGDSPVRFRMESIDFVSEIIRETEEWARAAMLPVKPVRRITPETLREMLDNVLVELSSSSQERADGMLKAIVSKGWVSRFLADLKDIEDVMILEVVQHKSSG